MSQNRPQTISKSPAPRHGHVFSPASRAYFAWQAGELDEGALNQRESGKFFPQTASGLKDAFAKDDVPNAAPPPDGKIASANQATGKKLDEPGSHWQKHPVRGGETCAFSWGFTANHPTRRWNYFITRQGWNPEKVLSRDQFEAEPFYTVQNNLQPHWEHTAELEPPSPTTHEIRLPDCIGYQVLLAVWEVVDTGNAFYQVVDLDFLPPEGGEGPTTPTGLAASNVTDKQVMLSWNAATSTFPIASYRITRNGITTVDIEAPLLTWTDSGVAPQTLYNYFVCAIDVRGNVSLPSRAIEVRTLSEGGAPSAPLNLHSMAQTAQSISLMWGASSGAAPIEKYLIFRNEVEVQSVNGNQTSLDDTRLSPDTEYSYFVKALDQSGRLSLPSNLLKVKTQGEGGEYPAWKLKTVYAKNDMVSHVRKHWRCIQAHTAHVDSWAPGEGDNVLWAEKS